MCDYHSTYSYYLVLYVTGLKIFYRQCKSDLPTPPIPKQEQKNINKQKKPQTLCNVHDDIYTSNTFTP